MRGLLARHSSLYKWAVGPIEQEAQTWKHIAHDYSTDLEEERIARADERTKLQADAVAERLRLRAAHHAEIARHDVANHRLRQTNRDLVGALRQRGIAAEEHPASKCLSCGSLAAVPEDGRHQMGVVRYPDRTVRLYCDGSEE